jgi:hypothetical protein
MAKVRLLLLRLLSVLLDAYSLILLAGTRPLFLFPKVSDHRFKHSLGGPATTVPEKLCTWFGESLQTHQLVTIIKPSRFNMNA